MTTNNRSVSERKSVVVVLSQLRSAAVTLHMFVHFLLNCNVLGCFGSLCSYFGRDKKSMWKEVDLIFDHLGSITVSISKIFMSLQH